MLKIRPLLHSDLSAIMKIEQRACQFPWTMGIFQDCLKSGYVCWGLDISNHLIGYGIVSVAAGESHVLNIVIDPDFQKKGYGNYLMRYLLYLAKKHGAEIIFLEVRTSNETAHRLYRQLGFNEIGIRKNYYPSKKGREDAIILALELNEDYQYYFPSPNIKEKTA
ncbi:MAG: ribosomal-protein-alanine N-acetyltransferase [Pseudomonadota bacterium]|jgi:ribosomal-protein-alanine N-acetyltransferase